MKIPYTFIVLLVLASQTTAFAWGFFAHKEINKLAVFTLPPELLFFYKQNIDYIEHQAVNPDKRRTILKEEGSRHYIDLDAYLDSIPLPLYWKDAILKYPEDTLQKHGIVPWHILKIAWQLTEAFKQKNTARILRLSADLGHYAADANVPLHTTTNYNGQLTNQHGIHGFWESRLPELFHLQYDFFVGKASYLENIQVAAWKAVNTAHLSVDSVLNFEKQLSKQFPQDKKYAFEERNGTTIKVYSEQYSRAYHKALNGMVEKRMCASILFVGSLWYTCWVNAGQPNLSEFELFVEPEEEKETSKKSDVHVEGCGH